MSELDAIATEIAAKCPHAAIRLRRLSKQVHMLPTWEYLHKFHLKACDVALGRTGEVQRAYMHNALQESHEERVVRLKNEIDDDQCCRLCPNPFPYWLAPRDDGRPIQHWLFWTKAKHSMQDALRIAREEFLEGTEVIITMNAPTHKTVPEIEHFHVFVCVA
jgi:hypothetical protein